MNEVGVLVSSNKGSFSSKDFGVENALAQYLRARFPTNTVCQTMATFDLSEGQAKGAVYAQASKSTLNAMIRVGGWPLWLHVGALVIGHGILTWVRSEKERLSDVQRKAAESDRELVEMAAGVTAFSGLGASGADGLAVRRLERGQSRCPGRAEPDRRSDL